MKVARLLASVLLLSAAGCHPPAAPSAAPRASGSLSPPPDFRNLAPEAGIRFAWHPRPGLWTIRTSLGCGAAFLDYDRDGRMDVFLAGRPRCALFHNEGGGKFRDVSKETGITHPGEWTGVAVGDYDNDGYPDLCVSGFNDVLLLHNNGGRSFSDRARAAGLREHEFGASCAFFDADQDGRLDLLIAHYVQTGPPTPDLCPGARGVRTGCPPMVYPPQFPRLYRNLGRGKFSDVTQAAGLGMAHGKGLGIQLLDYDNDGKLDFYLANDAKPEDLFHNLGRGRFVNVSMETDTAFGMDGQAQAGMGVDAADYDRDGLLDIAVSTFRNEPYSIYHNLGRRFEGATQKSGFGPEQPYVAFGVKFLDYDDDTWPDLVLVNGHVYNNVEQNDPGAAVRAPSLLFHNQGGTFVPVPHPGKGLEQPILGRGLAVGDVRNDGSQDLLIVDFDGQPLLLHNFRRLPRHWLGVELRGTRSNRDGYGARVTVQWPGGSSFRDSSAAGSFLSSMDPRLHFGLGDYGGPVTVSVLWPSGARSHLERVPVDQYLRITE